MRGTYPGFHRRPSFGSRGQRDRLPREDGFQLLLDCRPGENDSFGEESGDVAFAETIDVPGDCSIRSYRKNMLGDLQTPACHLLRYRSMTEREPDLQRLGNGLGIHRAIDQLPKRTPVVRNEV